MVKKTLLLTALLAVVAAGLWAGGAQELPMAAGEKQTIIYYLWDDPTYKNIVETFSSDSVELDPQYLQAGDYEAKLTTLLAGGAEMDAYMQKRATDMFVHNANGYIEPLDDLIAKTNYDTTSIDAYAAAVKVEGETLAVPFRGASWYTYFNKKLFEEAGLPTPADFVEDGEWTWDKFEEVANQIATGDGEVYGGLWYIWGVCQIPIALQHGSQFITVDGELDFGEPLIESFKMRKRLEESLAIIPLVELKVTKTHYSQAFYGGNVAMMIIGEWFPGMMLTARKDDLLQGFTWDDWGVTRLPNDEPTYRTFGGPTFNHVHSQSKKKEAAFEFIGWMGSADGAKVVAENGFLPPVVTQEVKDVMSEVIPDQRSLETFTEGPMVLPPFYNKYGSRVDLFMSSMMEQYLSSDWSDAELEQQIRKGLEEIVKTTD